jgi:hypothetical protein
MHTTPGYYHFAYPTPGQSNRQPLPFQLRQLRDGDAGWLMGKAIEEQGYTFEGPIINYPSPGPELIPVDTSRLRPTDLLLLTTRPPMHDRAFGEKRYIQRSYTTLEDDLFTRALSRYLERCSRTSVVLTDEAAGISPEIARRQSCTFRQNAGATYYRYGSPTTGGWRRFKKREPQRLTAAYLVYQEHAWPGGPALLAAFGMGGQETLVWCYRLARDLSHLLFTTSFVMAELRAPLLAEPPIWMDFAKDWEIEILGVAQCTPDRGPRRAA